MSDLTDGFIAHIVKTPGQYDSMCRMLAEEVQRLRTLVAGAVPADARPSPTYELLPCPQCHRHHVDGGEFATRPHHTHRCAGCGHEWDTGHRSFGIAPATIALGEDVVVEGRGMAAIVKAMAKEPEVKP